MSTLKGVEPELATGGDDGNGTPWGDIAIFFLWPLGLYLMWKQPRSFASHLRGLAAFVERRSEPELMTPGGKSGSPWIGLAAFLLWPLGLYLLLKQPRAFSSHLRSLAAFTESENKMDTMKGDMRGLASGGGDGEGIKPLYVGLAIFFIFPVGLYLLWKHPRLSRNKTWWWAGGIWSFLVFLGMLNGDKDKKPSADKATVAQTAPVRASQAAAPTQATEPDEDEEVEVSVPPATRNDPTSRKPQPKKVKVKKGINIANYERITDGMSRADVEAMLGKGRELASTGDEKAIVYETRNILTGSEKFIEVHYMGGLVTVKFKDGF